MLRQTLSAKNPWFPQETNLKLTIKRKESPNGSQQGGIADLINSGIGTDTRVRKVEYPLSPFSTTPEGDEDEHVVPTTQRGLKVSEHPDDAAAHAVLLAEEEQKQLLAQRSVAKEAAGAVTKQEQAKNASNTAPRRMKSAAAKSSSMGSHYVIGCKLGSGSFGTIYHCRNENKRKDYAIKMESSEDADGSSQLAQEAKILLLLENNVGFCKFAYCDFDFSHFPDKNLLVMDLLGPTLEDLFNLCNRVFTLKTVCLIAEQALNRIEVLHSKNYIHRDIKPENFMIGSGRKEQRTLFLGDFGLCKKYRDPKTLAHIPYRDGRSLSGTARYASLNAQAGVEQSRRDDLEGLFYTLLYLYKSELPWQGIQAPNKQEKHKRMLRMKKTMSIAELCMNCPPEFAKYLMYVRKLRFDEGPDYEYLRNLFRNMLRTWYNREFMRDYVQVSGREVAAANTSTNGVEERRAGAASGATTPRREEEEGDLANANNACKARKNPGAGSGEGSTRYGTPAREYSYNPAAFERYGAAPPAAGGSGNGLAHGAESESGSGCFERANSFVYHKENLHEALFDWEKQRNFHPKMKCSGMPELSDDENASGNGRSRGVSKANNRGQSHRSKSRGGKTPRGNGANGGEDANADAPNGATPRTYMNGGAAGLGAGAPGNSGNLNYLLESREKDQSNPRTVPGGPVMMERLNGASNSRRNVTPRQSSGALAEASRNSTAKFGRDDDRVGKKGGSALTRFIGFCNKKNPLPNTYTPR